MRWLSIFLFILPSCTSFFYPEYSEEELQDMRLPEQVYFEDSLTVFFSEHVNAFADRDLMWFTVLRPGAVEMRVSNTETDSLEGIYHFEPQDIPLHTLACRVDKERLVKCVLFVDGRRKCAKLYPSWYPLPQLWKTQFTIESP